MWGLGSCTTYQKPLFKIFTGSPIRQYGPVTGPYCLIQNAWGVQTKLTTLSCSTRLELPESAIKFVGPLRLWELDNTGQFLHCHWPVLSKVLKNPLLNETETIFGFPWKFATTIKDYHFHRFVILALILMAKSSYILRKLGAQLDSHWPALSNSKCTGVPNKSDHPIM